MGEYTESFSGWCRGCERMSLFEWNADTKSFECVYTCRQKQKPKPAR